LAEIASKLNDVLDAETPNVTESTWHATFRVVDVLTDIRRRYHTVPVHVNELRVRRTSRLTQHNNTTTNNNNDDDDDDDDDDDH